MSEDQRKFYLRKMKEFVQHWIGNSDIAVEARTFVTNFECEAMKLTSDEFKARLVKADTILCQAPDWLYKKYATSGISFRYPTTGQSEASAAA